MQMASLIEGLLAAEAHGIIEAGTGTGKTFAYLLPAMAAGKKVVISTGTKNLQDQLFYKDIPLVNEDFQLKTAILKGRMNYLCPDRLQKNIATASRYHSREILSELVRVNDWSLQTRTGDLTELTDLGSGTAALSLVTSTVDNCLGPECEHYADCPLYRARAVANEADLIVVNHHLLFADLNLKRAAVGQLLPDADLIIVDEAHQVADVARLFFGDRLSTGQFTELVRDIQKDQFLQGNDDPQLLEQTSLLSEELKSMMKVCHQPGVTLHQLLLQDDVRDRIEGVDLALAELIGHLQYRSDRSLLMRNCCSRAIRLADLFALLTESANCEDEYVHWMERYSDDSLGFSISLAPLNVAADLRPLLNDPGRSWLFVSATLTIAGSFEHFRNCLGLNELEADVIEEQFDSPFDFAAQVRGFIPENLPAPGNDQHTLGLIEAVLPIVRSTVGRCFMLFTSHRALRLAASLLDQEYDIVYLTQGALPKKLLLEKFRSLPRCVLLATQSFWEGVDVRGANLRCLIIDKLPFARPDDPLVQAQIRFIESSGGNGFIEYALPEAAISLKQGFGRLIRQESDRGLFIIGDARIRTRAYGDILISSLPAFEWFGLASEAMEYLSELDGAGSSLSTL